MPSPYEYQDYREYFRQEVSARKALDSKINFQSMANAMRVQKPFLSKVVNGHNHLTQDHLYLGCKYLRLSKNETDYLALTRDFQTSFLKERQDTLKGIIEKTQNDYLQTDKHITSSKIDAATSDSINEYYLDPIYQLVHVALSIARYSEDFRLLAKDLHIPVYRVTAAIERLEELKIVKREGAKINVIAHNLHLPHSAKEYPAWINLLRQEGMNRSRSLPKENSYGFSVVFSTDEKARQEIHERFLKFLNGVQNLVSSSDEKNIYQMNFDLINWNHPIQR